MRAREDPDGARFRLLARLKVRTPKRKKKKSFGSCHPPATEEVSELLAVGKLATAGVQLVGSANSLYALASQTSLTREVLLFRVAASQYLIHLSWQPAVHAVVMASYLISLPCGSKDLPRQGAREAACSVGSATPTPCQVGAASSRKLAVPSKRGLLHSGAVETKEPRDDVVSSRIALVEKPGTVDFPIPLVILLNPSSGTPFRISLRLIAFWQNYEW